MTARQLEACCPTLVLTLVGVGVNCKEMTCGVDVNRDNKQGEASKTL